MQMIQSLMKSRQWQRNAGCWRVCIDLNIQNKHISPRLCRPLTVALRMHSPQAKPFLSDFCRAPELGSALIQKKKETSWDPSPDCVNLVRAFSAYYDGSTMESIISVFILQIFTLKFKFPMLHIQMSLGVLKPASLHTSQCANNLTYGSSVWKIKDIIIDEPVYLFTPHSFDL